jgi:MarR family transcriptional regulator, organic hydroperoxide resistance regulator
MTIRRDQLEMAQEIHRDLQEVRRILRRPVEAEAARLKLTLPQLSVLQVLFNSERRSLKELSQQVGLTHATVSGIVDRLVEKGLVARQSDPKDGRVTKIMVSSRVRKYGHQRVAELTLHPLAEALSRSTPADRKAMLQGMRALRRAVGLLPQAEKEGSAPAKLPVPHNF